MITVQEKIDVLKIARGFIQEPDAWVQECHAWNHIGEETDPTDPDAVCFCLEGAIMRAMTELSPVIASEPSFMSELVEIDAEVMGSDGNICEWNDSPKRTHDEVLARVDATLERLEREAIASFGRARADEEVPQAISPGEGREMNEQPDGNTVITVEVTANHIYGANPDNTTD